MKDCSDKPGDGSTSDGSTSTSLLRRVQGNEQEAWKRLIQLYEPLVLTWCARLGLPEATAADTSQEVFRAVLQGIHSFRRDQATDSFRGWLYGITRNKVRDVWRRQAESAVALGGSTGYQTLQQLPASEEDRGSVADAEIRQVLRRALDFVRAEFTERSWKAFWQVVIDGRSASDVAADLGITPGAVYIAKSRILKRLREEFDGLEEID